MTGRWLTWRLVGSHAHGLAGPGSDVDLRGVFVIPARDLLDPWSAKTRPALPDGIAGDAESWEVGHFLRLASASNPSILEVLAGPEVKQHIGWIECNRRTYADRLSALLPDLWSSRGVYDAFRGYARSQQERAAGVNRQRYRKSSAARLRVLWMGATLLSEGHLPLNVTDHPIICQPLVNLRAGYLTTEEVEEHCLRWEAALVDAYTRNPAKLTRLDRAQGFLWDLRRLVGAQ